MKKRGSTAKLQSAPYRTYSDQGSSTQQPSRYERTLGLTLCQRSDDCSRTSVQGLEEGVDSDEARPADLKHKGKGEEAARRHRQVLGVPPLTLFSVVNTLLATFFRPSWRLPSRRLFPIVVTFVTSCLPVSDAPPCPPRASSTGSWIMEGHSERTHLQGLSSCSPFSPHR